MTRPDTIGGHSREALIWACSPGFNNENCVTTSMVKAVAFRVTRDPAELAELLAEALRERGVLIVENGDDPGDDMRFPAAEVFVENGCVGMHLYRTWKDCENEPSYTDRPLPMTRAALLRILELPEGATAADAMKALEVGK